MGRPGQLLLIENCSVIYARKFGSPVASVDDVELRAGDLAIVVGAAGEDDVLFHSRSGSLIRSPGGSWLRAIG